jgi:hypothetical protein
MKGILDFRRAGVILATLGSLLFGRAGYAQTQNADLNRVHSDHSHCLVSYYLPDSDSEIRNERDIPISCRCRDAIVDLRYVYQTYSKDPNMDMPVLELESNTYNWCGQDQRISHVKDDPGWKWNGPEVARVYPPDEVIDQIPLDEKGRRTVQYQVVLTFRDTKGQVTRTEQFAVVIRVWPTMKWR